MSYLDNWDVIWDGSMGPLLPPRPTQPDGRWNGMPTMDEGVKPIEVKTNPNYWDRRPTSGRGKWQHRKPLKVITHQDEAAAQAGRIAGQRSECVSQAEDTTTGRRETTLWQRSIE